MNVLTKIVRFPVKLYTWLVSPLLGPSCRFHPTCSAYTLQALDKHGIIKGLWLGAARIMKCHPWCTCHWHDPVPLVFTFGDLFGYKRRQENSSNVTMTAERE